MRNLKSIFIYNAKHMLWVLKRTRDGSFEYPKHMLKLINKFFFQFYTKIFVNHTYVYILKCKRNATVFNPLFLQPGSNEANFFIIACVPAH